MKKTVGIVLCLVVVCGAGLYFLMQKKSAGGQYARCLPQDVVATLNLTHVNTLADGFAASALGRFAAKDAVHAMMQEMGDSLMMTADLFDTPEGRAALDYVKTVIAAGASTGFSIGFVPRKAETVTIDGRVAERFLEIEMREVSITPMPAVPGADVTSARAEAVPAMDRSDVELLTMAAAAALDALPAETRAGLLVRYVGSRTDDGDGATVLNANANGPTTPATATDSSATNAADSRHLSHAQRVSAVRSSFNY